MKGMGSIHRTNQISLPEQPIQLPTLHVNMGESGVIGTREEVKQYLNQAHAEKYCVVPLFSSPDSLQTAIGVLQSLLEQIDSRPHDYLLPLERDHSAQVENPQSTLAENLRHRAHVENLYRAGQKNKAREYIEKHIAEIDVNYDEGILLQRAAEMDDPEALTLLLSKNPESDWAFGVFEEAAGSGYEQCTKKLIDYLMEKKVDLREITYSTAYNNYSHIQNLIDKALAVQPSL
jgi:hypothetical protein